MKISDFDEPIEVEMPGMFFLWCCDCGLRHIVLVDRKGKNRVQMAFVRDDDATEIIRKKKRGAK